MHLWKEMYFIEKQYVLQGNHRISNWVCWLVALHLIWISSLSRTLSFHSHGISEKREDISLNIMSCKPWKAKYATIYEMYSIFWVYMSASNIIRPVMHRPTTLHYVCSPYKYMMQCTLHALNLSLKIDLFPKSQPPTALIMMRWFLVHSHSHNLDKILTKSDHLHTIFPAWMGKNRSASSRSSVQTSMTRLKGRVTKSRTRSGNTYAERIPACRILLYAEIASSGVLG
jgi:hypothetical protein